MKTTSRILGLLLLLALPAMACNLTAAPDPTPAATATEQPPATSAPLATATSPPSTEVPASPTAIPTPTETPDPQSSFIPYESEALGLAVRYPESWYIAEDADALTIVSDEAILEDDDFTRGAGIILGGDPDMGLLSASGILDLFVSPDAGLLTDAEVVQEPRDIQVQGQDAVQATYEGALEGQMVRATITVIVRGSAAVFAAAITPPQGDPELESVLATIVSTIEVLGVPPPEVAGELQFGATESGTIRVNGSAEWTITVDGTEAINVVVMPEEELDAVLDVLDADGASVLTGGAVDDSFGEEETGSLTLPAGTYTVVISGFGPSSGSYEVRLEAGAGGPLTTTPIRAGDALGGALADGEAAGYGFAGSAGEEFAFTVTPDGELDVVLTFLSANGAELESIDNSFGEEVYSFYPPEDGEYTLVITSYDGSPGSYTVSLQLNPVASDASDGLDLPIVPGDGVFVEETRTIVSGETAEYVVPGLQYSPLTIVVTPWEDLDVVIDVYDADGTLVASQDRALDYEEALFIPETDGDYRVVVSGYEGDEGTFDVAIFRGGVGGVGFVGSIVAAGDTLADEEDVHAYPFLTMSQDPALALVYPREQLDVVIDVVDNDQEANVRTVDANTGYERMLFLPAGEEGDFLFNVRGFEGETGAYDIFLLGGPDVVFELAGGDTIYGNLGDGAFLFFTYNAFAGETLELEVTPTAGLDAVVEIEPFEGDPFVSADDGLEGESEFASYTFTEDEVVLVVVRGFAEGTGRFTMLVDVR